MFTKRSVGLADDQLTGPILGRSAGLQTELGQFGWKSKVRKTQGPFDKKVSGLRLARQDATSSFARSRGSNTWPGASTTQGQLGGPAGRPQGLRPGPDAALSSKLGTAGRPEASNLALMHDRLAHLT